MWILLVVWRLHKSFCLWYVNQKDDSSVSQVWQVNFFVNMQFCRPQVLNSLLQNIYPNSIKVYKIPTSTNSFEINHWFSSGEVPLPGFAGYGASKAALISFSGAIRQELSCWGVKVIIILPGAFKTSENKSPFTPITNDNCISHNTNRHYAVYGKHAVVNKCSNS